MDGAPGVRGFPPLRQKQGLRKDGAPGGAAHSASTERRSEISRRRSSMIRRAIPLFHVKNAAEAVKFYCHGLGFQLEFEHRPEGVTGDPCYVGMSRDGVCVHLSSFGGSGVG